MAKYIFRFLSKVGKILIWKNAFRGRLGNDRGQTLISWLVIMSLILTLFTAIGSALVLTQDHRHVTTLCRIESLRLQSQIEPLIKRLFAMNPTSKLLRSLMLQAKIEFAVAVASRNPAHIYSAGQKIREIRQRQRELDRAQKFIVLAANQKLHVGTYGIYQKLNQALTQIRLKNSAWAKIQSFQHNPRLKKFAARRADPQLAPEYFPQNEFEKNQAVSQAWQIHYAYDGFFNFKHTANGQCTATLEEETWVPKNQKGQAVLEMALVMTLFLIFWMFVQKNIENQKSQFKKWKIGHDSKIQFQKYN